MTDYHFTETMLPADVTDGDALDILRLTCKAEGLRRAMSGDYRNAYRPDLRAALDATKLELSYLTTRYR